MAGGLTPAAAKSLGSRKGMEKSGFKLDISLWNRDRRQVMETAIRSRFAQDERFSSIVKRLTAEGVYLLHFERGPDPFWGGRISKADGKLVGKNILGKIIMNL
jgi:predicted NAD-dependent protein-ADP-ribosyltransferase YbiA (DUF1768 family)